MDRVLAKGFFDHSPILIKVPNEIANGMNPFKYFHMWSMVVDFTMRVRNTQIHGCEMFKVVRKLKLVNQSLKQLNKVGFNQIQANDSRALEAHR